MVNGLTRLQSRFLGEPQRVDELKRRIGEDLDARAAAAAGLVTFAPDDIDWDDEVRIAIEERAAFSPDALTGMEASLRFGGPETVESKIFARLSAWQNWIFQRGERGGRAGGAPRVRDGPAPGVRSEESLMAIDYQERIPNNVSLHENRRLLRALEEWQPRFLQWWSDMGPEGFQARDVYLRTATSVDAQGWAHFDYVRMPDYRWGIFLAEPEASRTIGFGAHRGQPAWQDVPGEYRGHAPAADRHAGGHRARVGRAAAPARADVPVALRPPQPVPGERGGGPAPLGDGLSPARPLRPRRPGGGRGAAPAAIGGPRQAADPRRLQRADARLALLLHVHVLHRPGRQVPAGEPGRERVRPAVAHLPLHADRGSAPHVRRRDGYRARRPAHVRAHAGAPDGRRPPVRRPRPGDDPAVPELPLLGLARPVRRRDLDQRRQLLHRRAQGPVRRGEEGRRSSPRRGDLPRHPGGRRADRDAGGAGAAGAQRAPARRLHRGLPARRRPLEPGHPQARDRRQPAAAPPGLSPGHRDLRRDARLARTARSSPRRNGTPGARSGSRATPIRRSSRA